MMLTTHVHLVLMLRINGFIAPFLICLCGVVFLIKHRDKFYYFFRLL